MKILLIHWYYPPQIGGVETILKGMAETLAARGHQVTVYAVKVDEQKDIEYPGVKIIRDSDFKPARDQDDKALKRFKEKISQELHANDIVLSQNMSIDLAYNQSKIIYDLAQQLNIPHGDHMHCDNNTAQGVELLNHPWKKLILGVSNFHRDNLKKLIIPDNKTPVLTLYNGTDITEFDPETTEGKVLNYPAIEHVVNKFKEMNVLGGKGGVTVGSIKSYFKTQGLANGEKIILCSARLVNPDGKPTYRKGIDILLKALRRLLEKYPEDKWKVVLTAPRSYGSTEKEYGERQRLLAAFGDDLTLLLNNGKIIYFPPGGGFIPIFMLLKAVDIYCQPSKAEPFGLVFIEAMAMRKITIGADNGAIPEIITNGKTGFLIKDQQGYKELAEILHRILGLDLQSLNEIGKAAQQEVVSRFSLNSMVDKLEEYIDIYLRPFKNLA
jgi:glycosyltransferase involved in cell wall biosynthesis